MEKIEKIDRVAFERRFKLLHTKYKQQHILEIAILKHVGLKNGRNLDIIDVPLGDKEGNYIHTLACGSANNPPLLLIHGYAGFAIMFYLCLKELSKHFRVYAIDFIGNGSSKRCTFKETQTKESIDFIVKIIDL